MRLIVRPIEAWPGELTKVRKPSPFSASYGATLELLDTELAALDVRADPVLQRALRPEDMRLNGEVRANARSESHPGVILSFTSRTRGDLSYPCDAFDVRYRNQVGWQENLRAIALGLEALRKVERYGIANRGQQYAGWKQLGAGTPMPPPQMTLEGAAALLASYYDAFSAEDLLMEATTCEKREWIDTAYRMAAKYLHPDAGGDPGLFRRLTEARDLLMGANG